MRHGMAGNKFGRNQKLREATLRDLAKATFVHQRIRTTRAKAVEARKLIDKLITMGKENTLAAKRRAFAIICDHKLVSNLFNVIAPRFKNRHGGYTRIIKFAANRQGDNAEMVLLELTEKDLSTLTSVESKKDVKGAIEEAQVVSEKTSDKKAKSEKKAGVKDDKQDKGKNKK